MKPTFFIHSLALGRTALGLTAFASLMLGAHPAAAQSFESLYVGENASMTDTVTPGSASLSDTGTTVSGNYDLIRYQGDTTPLDKITYLNDFFVYNTSTAAITGGKIDALSLMDSSTATISGGNIGEVLMSNNSNLTVTQGNINFLFAQSMGNTTISGGNIGELTVTAGSNHVSGGNIHNLGINSGIVNISGGNIAPVYLLDTGVLNLIGTNFVQSAPTLIYNSFGNSYLESTITGTLQDSPNTPFQLLYNSVKLYKGSAFGGTLEFNGVPANPVPEASTTFSFGLLLALGGLALLRRSKAAVGS